MRQSLLPLDRVGFFFCFFVFFLDNAPQSFLTLNRVVGGQPLDNARQVNQTSPRRLCNRLRLLPLTAASAHTPKSLPSTQSDNRDAKQPPNNATHTCTPQHTPRTPIPPNTHHTHLLRTRLRTAHPRRRVLPSCPTPRVPPTLMLRRCPCRRTCGATGLRQRAHTQLRNTLPRALRPARGLLEQSTLVHFDVALLQLGLCPHCRELRRRRRLRCSVGAYCSALRRILARQSDAGLLCCVAAALLVSCGGCPRACCLGARHRHG
jgi:hypothetical protein